MRLRVVCGFGVTMATFSPTSAFSSVLLPALGRPMMETNPERKATSGQRSRRMALRKRAAHSHCLHFTFSGFQHFELEAVFLDDFPGVEHASHQRAQQPADGRAIVRVEMK